MCAFFGGSYLCGCLCVTIHGCITMRTNVNLGCLPSWTVYVILRGKVSHWLTQRLPCRSGWLAQEPQRPAGLCLLIAGIISTQSPCLAFCMDAGGWRQVLGLMWQTLHWLNHLSRRECLSKTGRPLVRIWWATQGWIVRMGPVSCDSWSLMELATHLSLFPSLPYMH